MSLVTYGGKLLLSPNGKLTLGPAAAACCCGGTGVETPCCPGKVIPTTLTLTISESTDETKVPNQTTTITNIPGSYTWTNVYDLGEDYGGEGAGRFNHECAGSEEDGYYWVYDATEAVSFPYDTEQCDPVVCVVTHTHIAIPGVTAKYTVTE